MIGVQGVSLCLAKNVWMTTHQFLGKLAHHFLDREGARFGPDLGMEQDLQQEVAQFLPQFARILPVNRVQNLVGLLEQVGLQRVMGLLPVPWTPVRRPELGHQLYEFIKPF